MRVLGVFVGEVVDVFVLEEELLVVCFLCMYGECLG